MLTYKIIDASQAKSINLYKIIRLLLGYLSSGLIAALGLKLGS
jgi:hypothetical protein